MEGIEKIIAKILQDAEEESAALKAEAQVQAEELLTRAREEAARISADLEKRGQKAADERLERLSSAAGMERRKLELAAKQQVLQEAFDKALDDLCELPEQEYIALLTALVLEASTTGKEKIVFSARDRARIGKQVVVAANEAMVQGVVPELPGSIAETKVGAFLGRVVNSTAARVTGTGMITLSEETRDMRGGFVLVDGNVEVNCTFEMLIRLQREKLERDVAKILFD